jgi:hypothetical protein
MSFVKSKAGDQPYAEGHAPSVSRHSPALSNRECTVVMGGGHQL